MTFKGYKVFLTTLQKGIYIKPEPRKILTTIPNKKQPVSKTYTLNLLVCQSDRARTSMKNADWRGWGPIHNGTLWTYIGVNNEENVVFLDEEDSL